MKIVILTKIIIYLLLLAFVLIEDPLIVTGFLVAVAAGVFFAHKHLPAKVASINEAFVQNIPKVGMVAFVLALTFPFAIDGDPYWLQIIDFAILNAIMALGLNFMTGRAGLICLGYAAFEAIGAYTVGIMCLKMGLSFWIAFPLGGILACIFGVVLGLPALRVKGHYLALVTIAFGLIVQEILLNWESVTGGTNGLIDIPSPSLFGFDFGTPTDLGFTSLPYLGNFFYLGLVVLALATMIVYRFSNSFFGLLLNAMREDELAAQCYGLNLTNYKLYAFGIGAFFGGLAGGIYAGMINFIAPENFGYGLSVIVISMIILGGLDSIPGAIVGAFFLTIFPEKFRAFEDYRIMFYGFIIVFCLLFMREGVLPYKLRIFKALGLDTKEAEASKEAA